jgi:hypothetical protein
LSGTDGGAIYNQGSLGHNCACVAVSDSTFYNNYAGEYQAGDFEPAPPRAAFGIAFTPAKGGAIDNKGGSLLVWGSTFTADSEHGNAEIESEAGTVLLAADSEGRGAMSTAARASSEHWPITAS